jgi:ABC-type dipeptide/oligopeptide/nickel transport system permease subunit
MTLTETKKRDWRDSNWYVGITSFWSEFKRYKIGLVGIVVLLMFVGMAITAPMLATHDPSPNNKVAPSFLAPSWMSLFDPTGVVTEQRIPDPFFENDPGFTTVGNSADTFSGVHGDSDSSYGRGHVNLTWAHTAGTALNFTEDPERHMPDTGDFIYTTQTFDWPYDRLPSDVNITLEFGTTVTGDFDSEYGGLMFKVYMWLIDSAGNWQRVYQSSPPYQHDPLSRRIDLNYFDIAAGWRGMVADADGIQEDPEDELTVAIGLAPTSNFEDFLGDTPWERYNGDVTVTVTQIEMVPYGDYFGLLGSTDKGADAWSQLVYGSRISLIIGILATALSTIVGVVVGMTAGYFGGKTDEVLMRIVDFLLVIPGLPLMMVLAAFLGPTIENIIVVISILGWTGTSRLIRSQVMAEKNKAYVESARAIGASDTYIIYRHILPNVTPILFADITLGVVGAILSESGLAFLGLTDPSEPSWGRMLADAQGTGGFSQGAWWVVVFPGLMITIISLAFTFVGHTLDQVLNPRLRER